MSEHDDDFQVGDRVQVIRRRERFGEPASGVVIERGPWTVDLFEDDGAPEFMMCRDGVRVRMDWPDFDEAVDLWFSPDELALEQPIRAENRGD